MFDEIRDALPEELRPQLAAIVNQMVDLTGQVTHWQRTAEFMRDNNMRMAERMGTLGGKVEIARSRAGLFKQRLRVEREAHNTTKKQLADEQRNRNVLAHGMTMEWVRTHRPEVSRG